MLVFETVLVLLFGAALLSIAARARGVPYPTLLALAGAGIALVPGLPTLDLPPDLILALFVAPILLDASYDMSLRDLRRNWQPVLSLVVAAVVLTTAAVAVVAHALVPGMPWGAAVALGALLAPPDAVAALAVMRHAAPPHRIRMVIEGESLLNDASSLLIYRLAVTAVAAGGFSPQAAIPPFVLVVFGSVIAGWCLSRLASILIRRVDDAATSTVLQFVMTFGVWLLAERLHLSGVATVVSFGLTAARASTSAMPATVARALVRDLGGGHFRPECFRLPAGRPAAASDSADHRGWSGLRLVPCALWRFLWSSLPCDSAGFFCFGRCFARICAGAMRWIAGSLSRQRWSLAGQECAAS